MLKSDQDDSLLRMVSTEAERSSVLGEEVTPGGNDWVPFEETAEGCAYALDRRYANKGPAWIRRRLETEEDPDEIRALEASLRLWPSRAAGTEAGLDTRPPRREMRRVGDLRDCQTEERATHVYVGGELSARTAMPDDGTDGEVIDWDELDGEEDLGDEGITHFEAGAERGCDVLLRHVRGLRDDR